MKLDDVLHIDTSIKIPINYGHEEHTLTLYEIARWSSLMRGIDYIEKRASELKIDLTRDKGWIKPLALQKYIDEETPSMVTEIKNLLDEEEQEQNALYSRNTDSC